MPKNGGGLLKQNGKTLGGARHQLRFFRSLQGFELESHGIVFKTPPQLKRTRSVLMLLIQNSKEKL